MTEPAYDPLSAIDHRYKALREAGQHPAAEDRTEPRSRYDRTLYLESAELAESLTNAEYAYVVGKLGEGGPERLFGVSR